MPKLTKTLIISPIVRFWQRGIWQKLLLSLTVAIILLIGGMYAIARWYIYTESYKSFVLGTSFIPAYAESLGLDAEDTMDALINDLGVRHFRLVSYWDQMEPEEGKYDFSLLDWQFKKAEYGGAKITLSLGLRQPRWPECHMPDWARAKAINPSSSGPASENITQPWENDLEAFITQVVNRYKDSIALDSYQVENEYFLKGFGNCESIPGSMRRTRLINEYNLVKRLDWRHQVIIARSNNALGWPVGEPTPDKYGISIYKRVWDTHTRRYLEYPFPAWFYGFVAGWEKLMTGKDLMIHELQAETWPPNYQRIQDTPLEEQNKSFDAERFKHRIQFGKGTGMREMYLWGSEYWYYRKEKLHDPSLWNVARQNFRDPNL